jgi:PAS domain S-box-containing protein
MTTDDKRNARSPSNNSARDIAPVSDRMHESYHQIVELARLHGKLSVVLAGTAPLAEILQASCQQLVDSLDAAFARVWLVNEHEPVLQLVASAGIYRHLDGAHSRVPIGQLKIGRIAAQKKALLTNDVQTDPNIGDPQWAKREGMVAFAGYPLAVEDRVVGVVALFARHTLSPEVFEQLSPMADGLAQCIARKESEQALIDRERQLHLALEAGRLGTWQWDIAADYVHWSDHLYDLFDYTKSQFVPTCAGFLSIIHPQDRDRVKQQIERIFAGTCDSYDMEFRVIRGNDKQVVWTFGRGVIQRDESNQPLSVSAVASDITDRKRMELQVADREAHLRRVIDNMLGFVGVLRPDGTLIDANRAALSTAGLTRDDVINKKFWDCYWWSFDSESAERLKASVKTAAAGELVRYDAIVRMAADSRMNIDFMIVPVRADDGTITHLIPSGIDITERKTAENELRQRERHLNLALEAGRMGSWEWDVVADRIVWSDQLYEVFGYQREEFKGTSAGFLEMVLPEDRHIVLHAIDSIKNSRSEHEHFECRTIRKNDGRVILAQCRGIVDRDAAGNALRVTGFAVDITEPKRQENELKDREAHLRRVINNQLGLVGVVDRDGKLVEIDDDSLNIAGLTRDEVIGRHFAECKWWTYDAETSQLIRKSMAKAFSGEIVRYDVPLYAAGDERLMIDFMIAPVFDDNGDVTYLIPSGVDISERVKAEHARKANEQRLKMALRAGGMAAWEWMPDQSIWTDALYEMLGIDKQQQASAEKMFERVHQDDLPGLVREWEKAISGEQPYNCEFRIIRPNGEIRWLAAVGEFERNEAGEVLRLNGLNWDITERKKAEQRRVRAAELEHLLLEASSVLASSLDYEKTLAAVTDLCVPTFADWAFIDLVDDEGPTRRVHVAHRNAADRDLAKSVASFPANLGQPDHSSPSGFFKGEAMLIRQFNDETLDKAAQNDQHAKVIRDVAPQSLIVVPLLSRNKSLGALTLVTAESGRTYNNNDLKAAKDLAQQAATAVDNARLYHAAQRANIAKSEFLANMSHEIRTPMTAVLGYADLLRERVHDDESREYLQTMRHNGEFLLEIINDILDLSKIEAGKLEVDKETFAPHHLIEEVRSVMAVRAAEKDLKLDVVYDGMIPEEIESDPKRLKQILINLVGNAIKFTHQGGIRIEVKFVSDVGPRLQITIADTGIGMTPQQQRQLFQPFSQADATVTREFGGTGLGLAISQRLAHLLGGEIGVHSVRGEGSTFTVQISTGASAGKRLVHPDVRIRNEKAAPPSREIGLKCRVLVVDDRRDIRFLSKRILATAGATVDEAEDGAIAVEYIHNCVGTARSPDLILLDMQMPNLDGYQTAQQLRQMGYSRPIIALTADAMQGDMQRCIESGCNAYLSKPIDAASLLELVSRLVACDKA